MNKADTPVSDENKEGIATNPEETDTPAENKGEPTAPSPQEKKVAELEGLVEDLKNQLQKQEAIAKTSQRKERIAELEMKKVKDRIKKIQNYFKKILL